jgi:hypothetical protein
VQSVSRTTRLLIPALLGLLLLGTACAGGRVMMPTPNLHLDRSRDFYGELHRDLKSTEVPLYYITDRQPARIARPPSGSDRQSWTWVPNTTGTNCSKRVGRASG